MPYRRIYFSSKAKSKAKATPEAAWVFYWFSIVGLSLSRLGFHLSSELGVSFLFWMLGLCLIGAFLGVWDGFH